MPSGFFVGTRVALAIRRSCETAQLGGGSARLPAVAQIVGQRVSLAQPTSTLSLFDYPLSLGRGGGDELAVQLVVDRINPRHRRAQVPTIDRVGVGKRVVTSVLTPDELLTKPLQRIPATAP